MKTLLVWSYTVAVLAGMELVFGINETGQRVALSILTASCMPVPIALAAREFCRRWVAEIQSLDEEWP